MPTGGTRREQISGYTSYRRLIVENMLTRQNHKNLLSFRPGDRITEGRRRVVYPPASACAIHLIRSLLQDKSVRLGSARYRQNDHHPIGRRTHAYKPKFVDANDSQEIKAHAYFKSIDWARLPFETPPFEPLITEDQDAAKYFENEAHILEGYSSSFISLKEKLSPHSTMREIKDIIGRHFDQYLAEDPEIEKIRLALENIPEIENAKLYYGPGYDVWRARRINDVARWKREEGINPEDEIRGLLRAKLERRKPKDKLLADRFEGRQVMELRKKQAFLGYTYRRPQYVFPEFARRDQPVYSRPTILPVGDFESA